MSKLITIVNLFLQTRGGPKNNITRNRFEVANDSVLNTIVCSYQDVEKGLDKLNKFKSPGQNNLIPLVLKNVGLNYREVSQNFSLFHDQFLYSTGLETGKCDTNT